jgi:hypothetical protein
VWEGSSPGSKPTRVFPDNTERPDLPLPSIEEKGFGLAQSLDSALSPRFHAVDRSATTNVPIEKLDSTLDGINLKSTALPPDVAKAVTPPSPTSLNSPTQKSIPQHSKANIRISLADLKQPDENLVRDAGHTPMASLGTDPDTSQQSPNLDIDMEENPLAPQTTLYRPAEPSDSYFPDVEDDLALKGPLSLQNDEGKDSGFLEELDQKLLDEARKALSGPSGSSTRDHPGDGQENQSEREAEPQLKLKKTTNFGTAFGSSQCGKV